MSDTADDIVMRMRAKYQAIAPYLNERSRRIWAANEARALGRGGQKWVHAATGLSCTTIRRGMSELDHDQGVTPHQVRKAGGGRKRLPPQEH